MFKNLIMFWSPLEYMQQACAAAPAEAMRSASDEATPLDKQARVATEVMNDSVKKYWAILGIKPPTG